MENRDFCRHPSSGQIFVGVHSLSDHCQFYAEYESSDERLDKFVLSYGEKKIVITRAFVTETLASDVVNHPDRCQGEKILCGSRYICALDDKVIVYKDENDVIEIPNEEEFVQIMRGCLECIEGIDRDIQAISTNETSIKEDRKYEVYHMPTKEWVYLETYIMELLLPIVLKKMFCAVSWGLGFGGLLCRDSTDNFNAALYALSENIGGRRYFCFDRAIGTIVPQELEARRGYIFPEFDFCPSDEWIIKEASDLYRPMLAEFTRDVIGMRQGEMIRGFMSGNPAQIGQVENDSIGLVLDIARHIPCECEVVVPI